MGGGSWRVIAIFALLGGCFAEFGPSSGPGTTRADDEPPIGSEDPDDANPGDGDGDGDGGENTLEPCDDGDAQLSAPDGTCYFTWKLMLFSWQAALEACEQRGAHLADIGSYAENTRAFGLAQETFATYPDFWIGGTDQTLEGTWRWTDGEKPVYKNWNVGQPANDNGWDDCMVLETYDSTGEWSSRTCNSFYSAICEREP